MEVCSIYVFKVLLVVVLFLLSVSGNGIDTSSDKWSEANTVWSDSWSYDDECDIAAYALKGKRSSMEDRYSVQENDQFIGFAIYDGHTGSDMASHAERSLLQFLLAELRPYSNFNASTIAKAISDKIVEFDNEALRNTLLSVSGTTAVLGILHRSKNVLFIANVGDSRAVIRTASAYKQITTDHKPDVPEEEKRIRGQHGTIVDGYVVRPYLRIGVSRSLGDSLFKNEGVIAEPDVIPIDVEKSKLKYVILASDGVWIKLGNKDAVRTVDRYIHDPLLAAKELATMASKKGSEDNISVMVVKFDKKGAASSNSR